LIGGPRAALGRSAGKRLRASAGGVATARKSPDRPGDPSRIRTELKARLSRTLCLAALIACAVAAAPMPLRAQSAADKAQSRTFAEQGIEAFRAGQFAVAVEKLEKAQALFAAPVPLVYLARSQAALGKLVEAGESYRTLARMALGKNPNAAARQAVTEGHAELTELEQRIPSLKIVITPPSTADLQLTIDSESVSPAVVGEARPTNPGAHVVRARARGLEPAEVTVELREGEHETVTLRLKPAEDTAGAAPGASQGAGTGGGASGGSSTIHRHFMARIGLGGGTFKDSFDVEGLRFLGIDVVNGSATGASVSGELTMTGSLSQGLLLGGGIFTEQVASPKITVNGEDASTVSVGVMVLVGPFIDWYPMKTGGLRVGAAIGGARITVKDSEGNIEDAEPAGGGGVGEIGYELSLSETFALGAELRFMGASLSANGLRHSVSVPSVLLTLSYD
jgi:hypothetical protein